MCEQVFALDAMKISHYIVEQLPLLPLLDTPLCIAVISESFTMMLYFCKLLDI